MTALEQEERSDVVALSLPPAKKVCAFSSMTTYGSHFRVDLQEGSARHVTYDSGVAELKYTMRTQSQPAAASHVELLRIGILKNILVLNYGNTNIVLMVVSWVPKHTHERPTLRRDAHGFWIADLAARPRDTTNPYIMPTMASQVRFLCHLPRLCYGLCSRTATHHCDL